MYTDKTLELNHTSDLQEAAEQLISMVKGLPQPVSIDVFLDKISTLSVGSLYQTDYGVLIQYRSLKTCAVSMLSAVDTLLRLSAGYRSDKESKLILSIQSSDDFLTSIIDWQGGFQERILRDLIQRYGENNRLEIPYGGVLLAPLAGSPYPYITVEAVHIDQNAFLIYDGITENHTAVSFGDWEMFPNAAYYVICKWYECHKTEMLLHQMR